MRGGLTWVSVASSENGNEGYSTARRRCMSTHLVVMVIQCLVSLLSACLHEVLGLKENIQLLLALYKYLLHMKQNIPYL